MQILKIVRHNTLAQALIISVILLASISSTAAAFECTGETTEAACGNPPSSSTSGSSSTSSTANSVGSTTPIGDDCTGTSTTSATGAQQCLQQDPIIVDLNDIVNVLAGLVGVVVVGTIIMGGVQYSMASDGSEAVTKAKQRITNGLLALAAFILTYSFLQWIIPGGIFS